MEHEKLASLNPDSPSGGLRDVGANDPASPSVLASALLDGELRGEEFARACSVLASDAQARQCWRDYHLVGQVLRKRMGELCAAVADKRTDDDLFLSRFHARLAQEAALAASPQERIEQLPSRQIPGRRAAARHGANDPYGAWRFTAGLCALLVVGLLGWQGVSGLQSASQARQLAQSRLDTRAQILADVVPQAMPQRVSQPLYASSMYTTPARTAQSLLSPQTPGLEGPLVMLRDPRLDHLMARQGSGAARSAAEGRFSSPRLGRAGVAAQGVLVNLDKSPALPR
ncbi:hypothetical protein AZ34_06760 [Hylemonella gracilis str. Niagara R]|uniref:Anti sigma-E protein RseA N-terminal domain-containing protein n=1 Tax=Hylemonella gracilis str. Niagara R TaxID=1458275 RepID=A0A016XLP1_9BURK|nr:sigma-E factor negative regulatory protein [Hylemonella gracilis]EYC52825.1 hypothetical protein AZ34_06760 [Hylemonella gracilis str. Niagara R]